jgi:hypothetical protein
VEREFGGEHPVELRQFTRGDEVFGAQSRLPPPEE